MATELRNFIAGFLRRGGQAILISTVLARGLTFFASWLALQLLPGESLGLILFAVSILSFFIPFAGFGAAQGLLRFGALREDPGEKDPFFIKLAKKGLVFSLMMVVFISVFAGFFTYSLPGAKYYLLILSALLIPQFLLELLKTYFRIIPDNNKYALIEFTHALLSLVLIFTGCFLLKEMGYVLALLLSPALTFLIFFPKKLSKILNDRSEQDPSGSFWRYSIFAGLSNTASQLLIAMDILLIGILLQNPIDVTHYKYISLLPFSLAIIPNIVLTTDFVRLTKAITDKKFIDTYIRNYLLIFVIITVLIWAVCLLFTNEILLFFGKDFQALKTEFYLLLAGISSVLLIRGLFGNLLSASGLSQLNFWISIAAIGLNLVLNILLIPRNGILGAALTTAITMWITSLLSVFLFYHYRKKVSGSF